MLMIPQTSRVAVDEYTVIMQDITGLPEKGQLTVSNSNDWLYHTVSRSITDDCLAIPLVGNLFLNKWNL